MRPPGLRKSRLRSINRISRPTLLCALPSVLKPRLYWWRMRRSLMSPAKGGFAIKMSKLKKFVFLGFGSECLEPIKAVSIGTYPPIISFCIVAPAFVIERVEV